MNIILMGPPGAGKGTQAGIITNQFSIPHISTGDMFREAVASGSGLGLEAQQYMNEGKLVPDGITIGIIEERITKPDCEKGFLLDGFPRTLVQAEALDKALIQLNKKVDAAINISVPNDVLIKRLSGRVSCSNCKSLYNLNSNPPRVPNKCDKCGGQLVQRTDDVGEVVRKRLDVYNSQTSPVLEYYKKKGILYDLDGNRSTSAVFEDIKQYLENL
ncbi:MAG: adenylate kinase [Syntrophomonadaceae bacterium]|nr:adenylate kinase [Syntrophomonadaceae bacterium]